MENISPLFTHICAQNKIGSSFSLNNSDPLQKQKFLLTQQWHHKQHYIWHNAELQFLWDWSQRLNSTLSPYVRVHCSKKWQHFIHHLCHHRYRWQACQHSHTSGWHVPHGTVRVRQKQTQPGKTVIKHLSRHSEWRSTASHNVAYLIVCIWITNNTRHSPTYHSHFQPWYNQHCSTRYSITIFTLFFTWF